MPVTINISKDGWVMQVLQVALAIAAKNAAMVRKHARLESLTDEHIRHVAEMFRRAEEIEFRLSGDEPFPPLDPKKVVMTVDL